MDPSDRTEPSDPPAADEGQAAPTTSTWVSGEAPAGPSPLDLDAVEQDLAGVEVALRRLEEGTYWTDEITGEPIPDDVLAADPVARRTA